MGVVTVLSHKQSGRGVGEPVLSWDAVQRFLFTHAAVYNTFNVQRHLISRKTHRLFRAEAMSLWKTATVAA